MIGRKLTFAEALRNGEFSIMAKQRLKIVRDDLYEQLDELVLCETSKAITTRQKTAAGQ
jgi:hypothetical protein